MNQPGAFLHFTIKDGIDPQLAEQLRNKPYPDRGLLPFASFADALAWAREPGRMAALTDDLWSVTNSILPPKNEWWGR